MTGKKLTVKFNNFFGKKIGQRNTPFVYFYFMPLVAYSKTTRQSQNLHLGWLYFTILIEIENDYRRTIPK
jgi:hypothetical protein